ILKFVDLIRTSKKMTLPKIILLIITFFINCYFAKATTYYVDNDGNNINNGTSPENAWQTLGKVNSYKFSPGDSILFKRGGIWRETLIISSSGSKGNNIVFGTYGTGNKPIFSGANIYSSWVQDGSNYSTTVSIIPKFAFDNQAALSTTTSKDSLTSGRFYFDTTNSRVYINYNPAGHVMEVSQRDNEISVNQNYVTIDGLQLQGGNYAGIKGQGSVNINNCAIRYNCSFGIFLHSNFLPSIISNNTVDNISGHGIEVYDSHFDIYGNTVDSIGIFHDAVKPFNTDPAGINLSVTDSSNVHNNTVSRVLSGGDNQNHGIYIADNSTNINVYNNTVHDNWYGDGIKFATNGIIYGNICYNNGVAGIGVHNNTNYAQNVNIHNNLCYNNTLGAINQYGMIQPVNLKIYNNTFYKNGYLRGEIFISNNVTSAIIKNNILYSSNNSVGLNAYGIQDSLVMNNNLYFNDSTLYVVKFGGGNKTLSQWQGMGYDNNSLNTIPLISNSDFHISSAFSPAILSGVDIYSGNPIDIGAYPYNNRSKSNAGADKTITLPIDSTSLKGSAGDKDVAISNSQWTKISGPSNYNITDTKSPITDVTGLTEGVYLFELKVTDNKGATATDTLTITVNPQKNISPNAGPDQTIMLPVNSIILTGSATDSNGQITKYLWEKISGPSDFNIENPNSAVTNVTGLTKGTYQFQLTVTDDKGA
ncbi:MAG TPA: right-handed parallel beta-helix repeat-containing protein, partial [Clostridia bacterium]|nr:right-handed parallel beta-helix repeat-containing protein [Clostridia bacterium]